ncbi:hypothetical protein HYH03_007222 [Edaphochlamys debaryana]|uniref:Uncharacterized protein n=1 Tax=Edaphochlamys debaryana TaxID=47281 RepID=A0A835Y4R7_9CHLO|nr:hypothetical protein HYH03_007222 [Edaphochlamys debaryana]|eukprot:KAG2494708.1 hypothetical protein HYH03_007222 [Edaphochlamys debaryana]
MPGCPAAGRPAELGTFRCAAGWEVAGTNLSSALQPTQPLSPVECEARCMEASQQGQGPGGEGGCTFFVSYADGACSLRRDPWGDPDSLDAAVQAASRASRPHPDVVVACSVPGSPQPLRFPEAYRTCACQEQTCYAVAQCVEGFEVYGAYGFSSPAPSMTSGGWHVDQGACLAACDANAHVCSFALLVANGTDRLCVARQPLDPASASLGGGASAEGLSADGFTGPSPRAHVLCELLGADSILALGAGRDAP